MSIIQAIILGIIQGLTEFLPVSSSGHLAIMKGLFGVETDMGILFDVLLHVATLLAVFLVFRKDVIKLVVEFFIIVKDTCINIAVWFRKVVFKENEAYVPLASTAYRKFVILLIISTIPTGILGILMDKLIGGVENSLLATGICLLGTGIILFISDFIADGSKKPKEATYGDAFAIGTAQGIATLPGISRSGTTIVACLLCGFDRKFAVKYSFIMSMPAILGALLLELFDLGGTSVSGTEVWGCILGMIFAFVIGYIALKLMMRLVLNKYFKYFAFYCFAIGALSIIVFLVKM